MDRDTRLIIIGLFAAQVFVFFPAQEAALAAKDFENVVEEFSPATPEQLGAKVRPKVQYKADSLRDPFEGYIKKKPGTVKGPKAQLPPLVVQGVIWGTSLPQAIINNKVVKVGDKIQGVEIIKIEKGRIEVVFEGWHYNLSSPGVSSKDKQEEKTKEGGTK